MDKSTKSFKFSSRLMKVAFVGLIIFLIATIINNLVVLLA